MIYKFSTFTESETMFSTTNAVFIPSALLIGFSLPLILAVLHLDYKHRALASLFGGIAMVNAYFVLVILAQDDMLKMLTGAASPTERFTGMSWGNLPPSLFNVVLVIGQALIVTSGLVVIDGRLQTRKRNRALLNDLKTGGLDLRHMKSSSPATGWVTEDAKLNPSPAAMRMREDNNDRLGFRGSNGGE